MVNYKSNRVQRISNVIIFFVIFLSLFKITPLSFLGPQYSSIFSEVLIIILLVLYLILNKFYILSNSIISRLFLILIIVSLLFNVRVFFGLNLNPKESFNYLYYFLIWVSFSHLRQSCKIKSTLIVFELLILINFSISILAYYNYDFFQLFSILFETTKTSTIGNPYDRFSGTFSNPNFLGFFSSFIALFSIIKLLNEFSFITFTNLAFSLVLLNASGSRTSILLMIGGLLIFFVIGFFGFHNNKFLRITFFRLSSVFILLLIFLFFTSNFINFEDFVNQRSIDIDNAISSFFGRYDNLSYWINSISRYFITGVGDFEGSLDNMFLRIAFESGFIVFLLFLFLLFTFNKILVDLKSKKTSYHWNSYVINLIIMIFILLSSFSMATFQVTQLFSILLIIISISAPIKNKYYGFN